MILPFTYIDEFVMMCGLPGEPLGVHMELQVEGHLDGSRLRDALRSAVICHPLAGARVLPARLADRTWRFAIDGDYEVDPLQEIDVDSEGELDVARDRLLNQPVAIEKPPLFRAVLAHRPHGDRLILNLAHYASDGIGMVRFLRSVQQVYAGEDDPRPAHDLMACRDLRHLLNVGNRSERRRRMEPLKRYAREAMRTAPTRLAPAGDRRGSGSSWANLRLSCDEVAAVHKRRLPGTTLNDVFLTAAHLSCAGWNHSRGRASNRIGITMPINMRPPQWRYEVVGNYVLAATVSTRAAERRDFASTLTAVAEWTSAYKETQGAGVQVFLEGIARGPVGVKRLAAHLIPDRAWETATLSNLGRVEEFGPFGAAGGRVVECWFSPPTMYPLEVAIGALSLGGDLFISMRYRRTKFDPESAHRFMELYRDMLLNAP